MLRNIVKNDVMYQKAAKQKEFEKIEKNIINEYFE